jgi:hypothetical protein
MSVQIYILIVHDAQGVSSGKKKKKKSGGGTVYKQVSLINTKYKLEREVKSS